MVLINRTLIGFAIASLLGQTLAHPGHDLSQEIAQRRQYLKHAPRDLSHCAAKLKARGMEARALERRSAAVHAKRDAVKAKKAKRNEDPWGQYGGQNGGQYGHGGQQSHGYGNPHTGGPYTTSSSSHPTTSVSSARTSSTSNKSSSFITSTLSSTRVSSYSSSISSSPSVSSSTTATTATSSVAGSSASIVAGTSGSSSSMSGSGIQSGTMPTGAMPSGAMPSGGGNSTGGNSTGDPGSSGSGSVSISTYGEQVANTSHLSNLTVTASTSDVEDIIYSNRSCILNPEGETGPFYVGGEYIRTDIRESQEGVPITIDGQFIDVATCEPIVDLYWDVWHCNSTGVYGGVIGNGNGNSDDASNINNTFLRGLQPSDSDGVAQFESIFPGHYAGRATHIHVVAHTNGSVLSNGTFSGGEIRHVGQFFFDQDLIDEINTNVSPYNNNTIAIVDNVDDRVFAAETDSDSDPVFDYVMLGDDVSDGLFMWVNVGIDTSATYTASEAAFYGANGGTIE